MNAPITPPITPRAVTPAQVERAAQAVEQAEAAAKRKRAVALDLAARFGRQRGYCVALDIQQARRVARREMGL